MGILVSSRFCATCGSSLSLDVLSGFCPGCLLNTVLETETETPSAGSRIEDYELLNEVARGGMGIVYRARQRRPSRVVALKMILPAHLNSLGAVNRFRSEAEAAASLEHEAILPIYAVGDHDGAPFYSMKFAEGGTLAARIDDYLDKPLQAAALITKLARAVAFAHDRGILHRDLKPGNVLFDSAEKPYVSDFGLAKWLARKTDLTQSLAVLGTPLYMAPEQAKDPHGVTAAADIFSLGAILYHLLSGSPPPVGDIPMEVMCRAGGQRSPRPRRSNRNVPPDVETICLKCLEKEPSWRYSSAAALADDLDRFCTGRAVRARRTGPLMRAGKWMRRNPTGALLAATMIALAAAVAWNVWRSELIRRPLTTGIAVLPFENLSPDSDNAYFADGIQDVIITRLSKIADLKVVSRTSTQHYESAPENLPEIAKQLGVAHILEGSVQKSGDTVRVNVQLIKAADDSHLWAETYDRKLADVLSVESEMAQAIADQLRAKLTVQEEQVIAAKPTDNPEAYDAYLRGLAYSLKAGGVTLVNSLGAQKYLREAVQLDPKFALSWALLSYVDARAYVTTTFQPTVALREEARQAAETALTLQPDLAEAVAAKGYYHYACLKDYDTAVRFFEQARQRMPNSSKLFQLLAYVTRRRGQWNLSESHFNDAERLDPRNADLLFQREQSYVQLRRFPEALRRLDQVLNITPDDLDTLVEKASIAQAQGDLRRAGEILAPLRPNADDATALETQVYQVILERRPGPLIPALKEVLSKPNPTLGFYIGELRFWLGWAQQLAGEHAAAQETWRHTRSELEGFLKEQPENYQLIGDLALTNMELGDKAVALALSERAMVAVPLEKDAIIGPIPIEVLARVAANTKEPDRALAALEKLLSIPSGGPLASHLPLTPALLRLDPMFDPLRNDPRFQKLCEEKPK
jgi:TolB-like protein/Tfp pilus assembly protein PilF